MTLALPLRAPATARALLALTKPRIIELLLVTTVPAMILAARSLPPPGLLAATVAGGALAAGGANALNMVCDRDLDARMTRTSRRPLVTGALSVRAATVFALGLEAVAFALLWLEADPLAAALALGAAAFYVGVYTRWLKRRTPQNIVVGGAAGAVPALVGWAAVTGSLSPAAWALFAVVLLWTPPHFWALAVRFREDYTKARIPMLPSVAGARTVGNEILAYSLATAAASLAVGVLGHLGPLYLAGAGLLGSWLLAAAWQLRREPSARRATALFHTSISYLALLFALVAVTALARS